MMCLFLLSTLVVVHKMYRLSYYRPHDSHRAWSYGNANVSSMKSVHAYHVLGIVWLAITRTCQMCKCRLVCVHFRYSNHTRRPTRHMWNTRGATYPTIIYYKTPDKKHGLLSRPNTQKRTS